MRSLVVLVAIIASTGCLAVSARAHVGGVTSEVGSGVQAGVMLGIGWATSERGAVIGSAGVATGSAPKFGLTSAIDYVHLPDRDGRGLAWRAGLGGVLAFKGTPTLVGPHAAALFLVHHARDRSEGHEKFGGSGTTHHALAVGLEGQVGLASRDIADSPIPGDIRHERSVGAGASLTLEWIMMGWMKL